MLPADIAVTVALVFSLFLNVPQLYKTATLKDVSSFSRYTILIRIAQHSCFVVYSLLVVDYYVLASACLGLVSETTLFVFTFAFETHDHVTRCATIIYRDEAGLGRPPTPGGSHFRGA
jgi:uncharacterized protein with PQ loop repeat